MARSKQKEIKIERLSNNVIQFQYPYVHKGWDAWVLLTGDRHFDSPYSDRDFQEKHLKEARRRNAHVIDVGDFFDVMQGKYDPRRKYNDLRPEYKVDNYLDAVVKDAADFFSPYAQNLALIGRGNHDSSILNRMSTDLISNLVYQINTKAKAKIFAGHYGGYVRFQFCIGGTQIVPKVLKYFHGAGGGGPVTRGVIQSNRQAVYTPDADIVVNGHTHDSWIVPIQRERLSSHGVVYQDTQLHIRTPSYKDEYRDGSEGWHVETWKPPKPIGAVWLRFFHEDRTVKVEAIQDLK